METYQKIIAFLTENQIPYRELQHEPEGKSEAVSKVRGSHIHQGAKAMVVSVEMTKTQRAYYLVVLPADHRLDFEKITQHAGGKRTQLASPERVLQMTGCVIGTVPPFSFNPDLPVLLDPALLDNQEIVFNAGRLDLSIFIPAEEYARALRAAVVSVSSLPI